MNRENPRRGAVLFDFDMTLIDSSYAITKCTNLMAEAKGLRPVGREEVLAGIGLPIEQCWERLWGQGIVGPDWQTFYRESFRSVEQENYLLFPGSLQVPETLKAMGYAVGVVSNRRFARIAVEKVGLAPVMDVIIGLEDVSRPKPDPQPLSVALEKLGVSSGDAYYVGDTDIDMKTSQAAAVRGIGVCTGYHDGEALLNAGAWRVCRALEDIPLVLGERQGR